MYNAELILDLIGKPFCDGGRGPDAYDCWGLVQEVYRRHGLALPEYQISCREASRIREQAEASRPQWERLERPESLAIVAMRMQPGRDWITHVGVFLADDCLLHTIAATGAAIVRASHPFYRHRIEGFYRHVAV